MVLCVFRTKTNMSFYFSYFICFLIQRTVFKNIYIYQTYTNLRTKTTDITHIVWSSTRRVGCARVDCYGGRGVFITCNYDPPGNYIGERPY